MRLEVGCKVIRDEVVVAVLGNAVDQSVEGAWVTELAGPDGVEDGGEVRIELEWSGAVDVIMTEVLNVLGQVAEKEDVVLANLTRDLDLSGSATGLSPIIRFLDLRWRHRRYR
jgi:hypothetical protein